MFGVVDIDGKNYPFPNGTTWSLIVTIIVIFIGFYLLRSIGLYKLAKKSDDKTMRKFAYFSFIPLIWVYVASRLAGRINIFGSEIKSYSLIVTCVYSVGSLALIIFNVICYMPLINHFLNGGEVYVMFGENYGALSPYVYNNTFATNVSVVPKNYSVGLDNFLNIMQSVSSILSFFGNILMIFVYIALFRKYWPMHTTSACILSIFKFFPILVFMIRNKEPIDYEKFVRDRYQQMYGGFNNYNQNNNNQNNYNQGNGDGGFSSKTNYNDDPFDNFSNGSTNNGSSSSFDDDPFEEFKGSDKN